MKRLLKLAVLPAVLLGALALCAPQEARADHRGRGHRNLYRGGHYHHHHHHHGHLHHRHGGWDSLYFRAYRPSYGIYFGYGGYGGGFNAFYGGYGGYGGYGYRPHGGFGGFCY